MLSVSTDVMIRPWRHGKLSNLCAEKKLHGWQPCLACPGQRHHHHLAWPLLLLCEGIVDRRQLQVMGPGQGGAGAPKRWGHGAVLYQLYVRSWRDTDDDGYGDLRGIIERLYHLSWLGVDGICLSPRMPSPDMDWGYDVSDYTGVHSELGTLADLDELIAQAGRRGMRVLLDQIGRA